MNKYLSALILYLLLITINNLKIYANFCPEIDNILANKSDSYILKVIVGCKKFDEIKLKNKFKNEKNFYRNLILKKYYMPDLGFYPKPKDLISIFQKVMIQKN